MGPRPSPLRRLLAASERVSAGPVFYRRRNEKWAPRPILTLRPFLPGGLEVPPDSPHSLCRFAPEACPGRPQKRKKPFESGPFIPGHLIYARKRYLQPLSGRLTPVTRRRRPARAAEFKGGGGEMASGEERLGRRLPPTAHDWSAPPRLRTSSAHSPGYRVFGLEKQTNRPALRRFSGPTTCSPYRNADYIPSADRSGMETI